MSVKCSYAASAGQLTAWYGTSRTEMEWDDNQEPTAADHGDVLYDIGINGIALQVNLIPFNHLEVFKNASNFCIVYTPGWLQLCKCLLCVNFSPRCEQTNAIILRILFVNKQL
jgi:hypothetical protein